MDEVISCSHHSGCTETAIHTCKVGGRVRRIPHLHIGNCEKLRKKYYRVHLISGLALLLLDLAEGKNTAVLERV